MPLIIFEGIDGCGKSTQAQVLHQAFIDAGYDAILTREPGGTVIGDAIREVVLNPKLTNWSTRAELLMHEASRAQLYDKVIAPALEKHKYVICDRGPLSSMVYQGVVGGLSLEEVSSLCMWASYGKAADLTIVLDVPAEVAKERNKGKEQDRIESKSESHHEQCRAAYKACGNDYTRVHIIDGLGNNSDVTARVLACVGKRWPSLQKLAKKI